ncbi:uncharacterized protein LOC122024172 [Zingiber officinale]|uniref:Uncharacterized protein n=1 Tax=Zingiber officinale TaxID=94328 RepID=A0A8J5HMW4_ZINOF|nr:uncharacterized protein LOC122024172 [Zingiber officinale]KAG6531172.1 hypothetical protein ZIOFF_004946 [Zingiber officinale]
MARATGGGKSYRFAAGEEEEAAAAGQVECSRSCTAVVVADCVALGCCPCAVAAALGWLALVKAPWAASRRCVRMLRRSLRRRRVGDDDRNDEKGKKKATPRGAEETVARRSDWEEARELVEGMGSRFEPDRIWLELYQIGQWGFGRLSFSGLQGGDS